MPSNWSTVDSAFPTFRGDESPKEMSIALMNYMKVLSDQIKYSLENLDSNNWNAAALQNLTDSVASGLAQDIMRISNMYNSLNGRLSNIQNQVSQLTEKVNSDVSSELLSINGNLDIIRREITALKGESV